MNSSQALKIGLDIILVSLLLILMDSSITGTNLHEWIGFGIFILFLFHIYLNRTFLKQVIHNFRNKTIGFKPKLMIGISYTLFLCITAIVVTGLFISPNYAPLLGIDNFSFWFPIHVSISCFTLLLSSVHVGLHWKAIFNVLKKSMGMVKTTQFQNVFLKGMALLVAIAGIRGMEQTQIIAQAFLPFSHSNKNENSTIINEPVMRKEELKNQEENNISTNNLLMSAAPMEVPYTVTFTKHSGEHGHHKDKWDEDDYEYDENYGNEFFFDDDKWNRDHYKYDEDYGNNSLFDEEDSYNNDAYTQVQPDATVEEILRNTNCTLCPKGCNLLNPDCGKGYGLQQQIISQYQNAQSSPSIENEQQQDQNQQEENPLLDGGNTPEQDAPFSNNQDQQNQLSDSINDQELEKLLDNTICTLCDKGCSLLRPQCNRGEEQAQAVIQKYNETNGDSSAIQSELANLGDKQNTDSLILDYMMSMGLVITSTYYASEALERRKRRKPKH